jgi:LuxR family maltose regulon positive regulatory protein
VDAVYLCTALTGEELYEHDETDAVVALPESRVDALEPVSFPDSVLRVPRSLAARTGSPAADWGPWHGWNVLRLQHVAGLGPVAVCQPHAAVHCRLQMGDVAATEVALLRTSEIDARHAHAEHSALGEIAVVCERTPIRWALARGDIDDAARRIAPLIANIEARGRQRLVAQRKLLQALIERRRGRGGAARQFTLAALRSGHRLRLVRSLLETDPEVMELVR